MITMTKQKRIERVLWWIAMLCLIALMLLVVRDSVYAGEKTKTSSTIVAKFTVSWLMSNRDHFDKVTWRLTSYSGASHHRAFDPNHDWAIHIDGYINDDGTPICWYPVAADKIWRSGYVEQSPRSAAKFMGIKEDGTPIFFVVMDMIAPPNYFADRIHSGYKYEFMNSRLDLPVEVVNKTGIYNRCSIVAGVRVLECYIIDAQFNSRTPKRRAVLMKRANWHHAKEAGA